MLVRQVCVQIRYIVLALFNYICDKNQGEKQPISGFEICSREYDKIIFDFWVLSDGELYV